MDLNQKCYIRKYTEFYEIFSPCLSLYFVVHYMPFTTISISAGCKVDEVKLSLVVRRTDSLRLL
jgi:hypothetical protein